MHGEDLFYGCSNGYCYDCSYRVGDEVEPVAVAASGQICLSQFHESAEKDGVDDGKKQFSCRRHLCLAAINVEPCGTRQSSVHDEVGPLVHQRYVFKRFYFGYRDERHYDDGERSNQCPQVTFQYVHRCICGVCSQKYGKNCIFALYSPKTVA